MTRGCACSTWSLDRGTTFDRGGFAERRRALAEFDLIHLHAFNLPLGAIAIKSGRPIVFTEHGNFGAGRKIGIAGRLTAPCAAALSPPSVRGDCGELQLDRRTAWPSSTASTRTGSRSSTTASTPRPARARLHGIQMSGIVVAFVGRLAGFKRVDRLLRALSQVRESAADSRADRRRGTARGRPEGPVLKPRLRFDGRVPRLSLRRGGHPVRERRARSAEPRRAIRAGHRRGLPSGSAAGGLRRWGWCARGSAAGRSHRRRRVPSWPAFSTSWPMNAAALDDAARQARARWAAERFPIDRTAACLPDPLPLGAGAAPRHEPDSAASISRLRARIAARRRGELGGLAADSLYVAVWQGATSLADLAQIALIAHVLGLDQYGRFVVVVAFVMLVTQFFDVRVGVAATTLGARAAPPGPATGCRDLPAQLPDRRGHRRARVRAGGRALLRRRAGPGRRQRRPPDRSSSPPRCSPRPSRTPRWQSCGCWTDTDWSPRTRSASRPSRIALIVGALLIFEGLVAGDSGPSGSPAARHRRASRDHRDFLSRRDGPPPVQGAGAGRREPIRAARCSPRSSIPTWCRTRGLRRPSFRPFSSVQSRDRCRPASTGSAWLRRPRSDASPIPHTPPSFLGCPGCSPPGVGSSVRRLIRAVLADSPFR